MPSIYIPDQPDTKPLVLYQTWPEKGGHRPWNWNFSTVRSVCLSPKSLTMQPGWHPFTFSDKGELTFIRDDLISMRVDCDIALREYHRLFSYDTARAVLLGCLPCRTAGIFQRNKTGSDTCTMQWYNLSAFKGFSSDIYCRSTAGMACRQRSRILTWWNGKPLDGRKGGRWRECCQRAVKIARHSKLFSKGTRRSLAQSPSSDLSCNFLKEPFSPISSSLQSQSLLHSYFVEICKMVKANSVLCLNVFLCRTREWKLTCFNHQKSQISTLNVSPPSYSVSQSPQGLCAAITSR